MADAPLFFTVFPEFGTLATVPQVTYWLGEALNQLAVGRLGLQADRAMMLFAAHNIVLGLRDVEDTQFDGQPGDSMGPVTSKGAAGLSVSYDANIVAIAGAGEYNATAYGQRLWKLLETVAMGGVYRAPAPLPVLFGYRGWRGIY